MFLDLKAKHGDKFDNPKLRLWSKMIASNLHDNYDTPPDIPAFSGCIPKKAKTQQFPRHYQMLQLPLLMYVVDIKMSLKDNIPMLPPCLMQFLPLNQFS